MPEFITKSDRETKKIAKLLAEEIVETKKRACPERAKRVEGAVVVGLQGDLGSGKTTFVQGFAKGLGIRQRLTSPTFVLLKQYRISKKQATSYKLQATSYLYHIDCYRLDNPKDLLELDFKEIISDSQNIVLIEWAEKVQKILPKNTIWMKFKVISEKERKISINV